MKERSSCFSLWRNVKQLILTWDSQQREYYFTLYKVKQYKSPVLANNHNPHQQHTIEAFPENKLHKSVSKY